MMRKCQHCGAKLRDTATVCIKCGYLQATAEPRAESVDPVEAAFPVIPVPAAVPEKPMQHAVPAAKLKTDRNLLKFILLSAITFGIYGIVVMEDISMDINLIAGRYDGKRTMSYCLVMFLFSWLTLGIVPLVWSHRISARIGEEIARRTVAYQFGAGTYWGWGFFGSLILVGPFIYTHKLLKAMNMLSMHYNLRG